jgi:hypothetical protein
LGLFSLSILSFSTTTIAPITSLIATLYSLLCLYSFLGCLPKSVIVDLCQSNFAATKLVAFLLGYLFDSCARGDLILGSREWPYITMTLMMGADAVYGLHQLLAKH